MAKKIVILCDESGKGLQAKDVLPKIALLENQEIVILIGPEGGFSNHENKLLSESNDVLSVSLGGKLLRSDTAITVSLFIIQQFIIY